MDSLALTDHGALYGAVEFYKKAKERGIKPIIGAELYLALERMTQERPNIDDKRYHLVLLAKNEKGYRNLVKLITRSHLEGFYYKPRVDEELLKEHAEGLVALSACLQGKIPQMILLNKMSEAEKTALFYRDIFGRDNFYLELQNHIHLPEQEKINKGLISLSKKLNIPLVATNDCHYLRPEDAEAQDILMLINTGADPNDPERLTMKKDDFSMKSPERMMKDFEETPQALENTQKIAESCNFDFVLGKTKLPRFETPDGKSPDEYLKELCEQGLKMRFGENPGKEAVDRLNYELSVISQTNFASYFLIVQDFVRWAKEKRIVVGPGRGSAAGSLAAFSLGITNVDPLKYNLLFERFLNPERAAGLPDIDLDFTDRRRDEVINYVAEKYGHDKVAQIITFGTMAARAVVRDVGRALNYPYSYCDKVAKMIPFGLTLNQTLAQVEEFRQFYLQEPNAQKLIDFAKKLEGCARHASTHACGVVISETALDNICPLQHPTQDDATIVTQYEMHSIEDLGLLKMDFLGLKNLTIIEDTLSRIYVVQNKKINIETIPQDDKKTFQLLQKGDCVGVFQLECLSGDTLVSNTTIKKLCERKDKRRLASLYLDEGKIHLNQVIDVLESGEKEVFNLVAENNWCIKSTKDHYFLTKDGWKQLGEIKAGDEVLIRNKAKHLIYNLCQRCGKQIYGHKEGGAKFCHRCAALFYRNPSKKESREKIRIARLKFYQQGGKPWNYGITTENNEIWRKTAEKISKALTGKTLEDRLGKERANELKKKASERFSGSGNPMFGRPSPHRKRGFRKDLGHFVRSSWEADFARVLKLYNLYYQYEPVTFRLTRTNGEILHYTPDFYVPSQNIFYEIKGFLRDLDQEKMELFQKQYPDSKLIIINNTKFAEFALKYKTLVDWECPQIPKSGFKFIKVRKIEYAGQEKTYDIAMQSPGNNFQANGFIVHNSDGMRRYLKELKPTELEDIIAMVALYRPGPMQLIPDYIAGKHKKKKIEYLHPKLKPLLEPTYGILLYQEQVMKIAQELAGFTLAQADFLRKAIGKKIRKLMMAQKEKFIEGAKKNGIEENISQKIWYWIEPFASYSFNRSHAAAYATIAYQTAYLKARFPVEFMASLLTSEKADIERIGFLIGESKKMGVEVLPPDLNESLENFTVVPGQNKIRFGLTAIKNVGWNVVECIVRERKASGPYQSIADFLARVDPKVLNKKSMESLIKSGVFDKLGERSQLVHNLENILEWSRETQKTKINGQKGLFEGMKFNNEFNLFSAAPASKKEKLSWEKELLGLFVSSHPLEGLGKIFEKKTVSISKIPDIPLSRKVRIGGVISDIKKIITKVGKPMLFVKLEDMTDKIEVVAFPGVIERNPSAFQENKIVLISGRVDNRDGVFKIICEEVEEIIET